MLGRLRRPELRCQQSSRSLKNTQLVFSHANITRIFRKDKMFFCEPLPFPWQSFCSWRGGERSILGHISNPDTLPVIDPHDRLWVLRANRFGLDLIWIGERSLAPTWFSERVHHDASPRTTDGSPPFSVIAFSAALREQEMAMRIALGSQRSGILGLVFVSAAKLAFGRLRSGIAGRPGSLSVAAVSLVQCEPL